ncbi:Lia operon protein LiaI OS=Ureibacillus acetophenoni OX=614649 GN=SAMN05877842_10456 PE=4 SV=1 [Ureibacillus acetophenoni]
MKKLLLLIAGGITFIIALAMVGPMIGMAFSALLVFLAMHFYVKSKSSFSKVMWVILGIIGILSAISNIPAIIGIVAIVILYVLYKKWKDEDVKVEFPTKSKSNDPFTNFEREWSNLTK